jgi:hypothetical protein
MKTGWLLEVDYVEYFPISGGWVNCGYFDTYKEAAARYVELVDGGHVIQDFKITFEGKGGQHVN